MPSRLGMARKLRRPYTCAYEQRAFRSDEAVTSRRKERRREKEKKREQMRGVGEGTRGKMPSE